MSKQEKIICLGKEFTSEEERREHFRNELRTKLPALKKVCLFAALTGIRWSDCEKITWGK